MAAFESELLAHLLARPALAAVVGDRIFPGRVPETVSRDAARVVYHLVSRRRDLTLDGAAWIARVRIQISAFSSDYADVVAVEEALRLAYEGYAGPIGSYSVVAKLLPPVDLPPEDPGDASDRATYHRAVDLVFRLAETPRPPVLVVHAWWPGPAAVSAWWPGPSPSP